MKQRCINLKTYVSFSLKRAFFVLLKLKGGDYMKKVNLVELCTYLANVYKEATGKYYSNELSDWLDDIERYENNATYLGSTNGGKVEN